MRRRKLLFVLVTVCFVLALMTPVYSQLTSGKGKISGTVTDDETGEPIEGVTVKLFFPEVKQFHKPYAKTNAEGKWRVFYIRKGLWNIDFVKDGYEVKKISFFVDSTPGTKNPPIDITLRKLAGPAVADIIMKEIAKASDLINEKKYDRALKDLEAIMEKYKEESGVDIVYLHIGNIYSFKNQYQKAIEFYLKSLEKFPDNKEIILSIGNAYNNLKDYEKSMEWYNKLKIDDIGNIDTLYNIGVISYNNGDFERALTFFKKTTEINSEFADGYYQLGMTYVGLEKNQEGVAALKKFMELAPDSPNYETAKAIVDAFGQ